MLNDNDVDNHDDDGDDDNVEDGDDDNGGTVAWRWTMSETNFEQLVFAKL